MALNNQQWLICLKTKPNFLDIYIDTNIYIDIDTNIYIIYINIMCCACVCVCICVCDVCIYVYMYPCIHIHIYKTQFLEGLFEFTKYKNKRGNDKIIHRV